MARIEELPDDYEEESGGDEVKKTNVTSNGAAEHGPALPPSMTEPKQSVDELVADLKKSPFFMTSLDDAGDEYNPQVEAIRALIYEGTRGEQASNFREQGNEDAKLKNWTDAREQYSKGLTALKTPRKAEDPTGEDEDQKELTLKELLLVNRALCQLELKNYRSCTLDCLAALEINPSNVKAHYRMASAFFALGRLSDAAAACHAGLTVDAKNAALLALQAKIKSQQELADGKESKRIEEENLKKKIADTLVQALKARQIKTRMTGKNPNKIRDAEIRLVPDPTSLKSTLVFPVWILYPVHLQGDQINAFGEEQTLQGHLEYLLPLPWDTKGEYTIDNVDAYIETPKGGLIKWGKKVELLKVLSGGKVEIIDGTLEVNIVPKNKAQRWIDHVKEHHGH